MAVPSSCGMLGKKSSGPFIAFKPVSSFARPDKIARNQPDKMAT
jgi:hypothetical protein